MAERLLDPATPNRIKSFALRLAPPNHKKIDVKLLRELYATNDHDLRVEVIRTLAASKTNDDRNGERLSSAASAKSLLLEVARSAELDPNMRADAVCGLGQYALGPESGEMVDALLDLAQDSNRSIRQEALRALRLVSLGESAREKLAKIRQRYPNMLASRGRFVACQLERRTSRCAGYSRVVETLDALPGSADPAAGRTNLSPCQHRSVRQLPSHSGRGNVVGPDLSLLALQGDRASLLRSILEPNRDVAPQYFATGA